MTINKENECRLEEELVGKTLKFEIDSSGGGLPTIDGKTLMELTEISLFTDAVGDSILVIKGFHTDEDGNLVMDEDDAAVGVVTKEFIVEGTLLVKLLDKVEEEA